MDTFPVYSSRQPGTYQYKPFVLTRVKKAQKIVGKSHIRNMIQGCCDLLWSVVTEYKPKDKTQLYFETLLYFAQHVSTLSGALPTLSVTFKTPSKIHMDFYPPKMAQNLVEMNFWAYNLNHFYSCYFIGIILCYQNGEGSQN